MKMFALQGIQEPGRGNPGQGGNIAGQGGNNDPVPSPKLTIPLGLSALGALLLLLFVAISVYKHIKERGWSRTDVIGVIGITVMVIGIVTSLLNPEIRKWLGL